MLQVFNFISVEQNIIYKTLIFVYKIKYNLQLNYLLKNIKYIFEFMSIIQEITKYFC